jgi:hypothetical protein
MKIVRTALFEKSLKKLGATETDIAKLERELAAQPQGGDVVPGLGGLRKMRFAMKGKGKRGGGRAIYFLLMVQDAAYLLLAYDKSVQSDLSQSQREAAKQMMKELADD